MPEHLKKTHFKIASVFVGRGWRVEGWLVIVLGLELAILMESEVRANTEQMFEIWQVCLKLRTLLNWDEIIVRFEDFLHRWSHFYIL